MQMPKLVALVSQLVKELDIKKVIKEVRPHEQPGMTCFDLIEDICIKTFLSLSLSCSRLYQQGRQYSNDWSQWWSN